MASKQTRRILEAEKQLWAQVYDNAWDARKGKAGEDLVLNIKFMAARLARALDKRRDRDVKLFGEILEGLMVEGSKEVRSALGLKSESRRVDIVETQSLRERV